MSVRRVEKECTDRVYFHNITLSLFTIIIYECIKLSTLVNRNQRWLGVKPGPGVMGTCRNAYAVAHEKATVADVVWTWVLLVSWKEATMERDTLPHRISRRERKLKHLVHDASTPMYSLVCRYLKSHHPISSKLNPPNSLSPVSYFYPKR